MQYRKDKYGNDISALAYGCLRFSKNGNKIDINKTEKEILRAIELGVNYFDTAYIYNGSEEALGEILERNNCRDKVYIADKLPHYMIKSRDGIEKTFKEMLRRLRTDHIDYFLMHMLTDVASWEKVKRLGIEDWIAEKKASGEIGQIGFSYHGSSNMFCRVVDAYDWDFCMIQYNYLDENSQAGKTGLRYASSKGLPVMIMEPLRGGKLVNLMPLSAGDMIKEHPKGYSRAEWSFRWLWDQKEVTAVLSGMNSIEMIEENCAVASDAGVGGLSADDLDFIERVKNEINKSMRVGCTGCAYCMPCPRGVDIPGTFSCYNQINTNGLKNARKVYLQNTLYRHDPSSASLCIGCGKCEQHCPQSIQIREELKNAAFELENAKYKLFRKGIHLLRLW